MLIPKPPRNFMVNPEMAVKNKKNGKLVNIAKFQPNTVIKIKKIPVPTPIHIK